MGPGGSARAKKCCRIVVFLPLLSRMLLLIWTRCGRCFRWHRWRRRWPKRKGVSSNTPINAAATPAFVGSGHSTPPMRKKSAKEDKQHVGLQAALREVAPRFWSLEIVAVLRHTHHAPALPGRTSNSKCPSDAPLRATNRFGLRGHLDFDFIRVLSSRGPFQAASSQEAFRNLKEGFGRLAKDQGAIWVYGISCVHFRCVWPRCRYDHR